MTTSLQVTPAPAYPTAEVPKREISRLASVQRAILALTEIVEDSVDLLGATLREESAKIPGRLIRPVAGILTASIGASFLTAAAVLYLRDLFGGWPLSFLALGSFYLLLGVLVWKTGRSR